MGCAIFPRKYNNCGELELVELRVSGVGVSGVGLAGEFVGIVSVVR